MEQYMLCTFPDEKKTQESNFLFFLAKFYIEKCNSFDNMVCTGEIILGSRYPANPFQRFLINWHADKVIQECVNIAKINGYCVDKKEILKRISKYRMEKRWENS